MSEAPICYSYHPSTAEFIGSGPADPNPVVPGKWLYPALTTLVAPPEPGEKQAVVWTGEAWEIVPDHRGETWYQDGQPRTITGLGDPAAQGLSPDAPPPPPAPVPPSISDRQFFQVLAMEGVITTAEALAAVRTGDIPAAMAALLDALPENERFAAEMKISGATSFERADSLVAFIGEQTGHDSAALDQIWITGAAL